MGGMETENNQCIAASQKFREQLEYGQLAVLPGIPYGLAGSGAGNFVVLIPGFSRFALINAGLFFTERQHLRPPAFFPAAAVATRFIFLHN